MFSNILEKVVVLANGRINNNLLNSGEIVTDKTLEDERKSGNLTQIQIDTNITMMENQLKSGNLIISEELVNTISNIIGDNHKLYIFSDNLPHNQNSTRRCRL